MGMKFGVEDMRECATAERAGAGLASKIGKGYFELNIIIIITLFLKKSRAGQLVVYYIACTVRQQHLATATRNFSLHFS